MLVVNEKQADGITLGEKSALVLLDNITSLDYRAAFLETEGCTDAALNETVSILEQRIADLEQAANQTIQELPMLIEMINGDNLSTGAPATDLVFTTGNGPNNWWTIEETDPAPFTSYNSAGAPPNTFVNVTEPGEYAIAVYHAIEPITTSSAGPRNTLVYEIVDGMDVVLEQKLFEFQELNRHEHFVYIADQPFFVRIRSFRSTAGTQTVFAPPTKFYIIKIQ